MNLEEARALLEDEEQRRLRAQNDPEKTLAAMWPDGGGIVPARMMRGIGYFGGSSVKVYRGIRKGAPEVILPGDWVALKRSYAAAHGTGGKEGANLIVTKRVDPNDVVWAGTDMNEWWYAPRR